MHNKQSNKYFFPDKIYFRKRSFHIDDVTFSDQVFYDTCGFVD